MQLLKLYYFSLVGLVYSLESSLVQNANGSLVVVTDQMLVNGRDVLAELAMERSKNTHLMARLQTIEARLGLRSFKSTVLSNSNYTAIAAGDIDHDGYIDIVAGGLSGLLWYRNPSADSNTTWTTTTIDTLKVYDIALGDTNDDNTTDIIVGSESGLFVYLNSGAGSFRSSTIESESAEYQQLSTFREHTGHIAIVGSRMPIDVSLQGSMGVWRPQGGGWNYTQHNAAFQRDKPVDIVTNDITGDGQLDVIFAQGEKVFAQGEYIIAFIPAEQIDIANVQAPQSVATGDYDGDGDVDVAFTNLGDNRSYWCENLDGSGNFSTKRALPTARNGFAIASADVDGDGMVDLITNAVAQDGTRTLLWLHAQTGSPEYRFKPVIIASDVQDATAIEAADVTGDGQMDVITLTKADPDDSTSQSELVVWS
eukprot:TRINITY_DN11917_c3_g7_i1.p1 TRINITY_DN11917_c3_g7~~TRINITY_DN11917_c3_g7_i1.p1  ORF type:complete len:424 (+),score=71.92 TRINITY_DN11917_c3_g7_i1:109-1380(+)